MKPKQSIPKHLRFTIQDFNNQFPNDDACLDWLKDSKFPAGLIPCAKCGKDRKHHRVTGRPAYACDYCGSMVSPMAGTIFEKSSTSLRIWFYAMYLMSATRCGISAKQLQRETGVTYKTAWRMFKQIRTLMSEDVSLEGEAVEMDETYVGGKRRNGSRGRATNGNKTCVVGVVERTGKGRVIAMPVTDASKKTLHGIAKEYILPESTVFTDDWSGYHGLEQVNGYQHRRINHSAGVYVMGDVHTNTIEGFWSLVKRGIGGVYHSVGKEYLPSYLNEYTWRYNRRNEQVPMFTLLLNEVSGRPE
ncbi:MAG TPA: IS1595 family transposase [Terracidiphilus sp.]|jgi:transposase-like protein